MIARAALVASLVALLGCARSHCSDATDPPATIRDAGLDAADACGRTGRAVIGPVMLAGAGVALPCEPGVEVRVELFGSSGARRWTLACEVGSHYLDLGEVPVGHYEVTAESPSSTIGAGGTRLRHPWCLADPSRVWCPPLEIDVEPCGTTVVPLVLFCDPAVRSDC